MDPEKEIQVLVRLSRVEDTLTAGFAAQQKANDAQDKKEEHQDKEIERIDERIDGLDQFKYKLLGLVGAIGLMWPIVWGIIQWLLKSSK